MTEWYIENEAAVYESPELHALIRTHEPVAWKIALEMKVQIED